MAKKTITTTLLLLFFSFAEMAAQVRYINPVLPQDYSDPDVCSDGRGYWMTASSFASSPGLPLLHSADLVRWDLVGYALPSLLTEGRVSVPSHGEGVWAPCIRFHSGRYYIYWGDPDVGIYVTSSSDPLGKWNEPRLVIAGKGYIDPSPLWDDDGRCYLVHGWAKSRCGFNSMLCVTELSADGMEAIGKDVLVYDGNKDGNHTVEGPKFYKRDGYYWIFAPAGGVEHGWQLAMRSENVYGPYEVRTVMAEGGSGINGPHQGAWVQVPGKEELWFLNFRDQRAFGRTVQLNPMRWNENGWPVIGEDADGDGCGEPVAQYTAPSQAQDGETEVFLPGSSPGGTVFEASSDGFNGGYGPGLQWQWNMENDGEVRGFATEEGFYRMFSSNAKRGVNLWTQPSILLQKIIYADYTATVKITFNSVSEGETCGLIVYGQDYSAICIEHTEEGFRFVLVTCEEADKGGAERRVALAEAPEETKTYGTFVRDVCGPVLLRVAIRRNGSLRYSYSIDGKNFTDAGAECKAREGRWVGARVGVFIENPEGKGRGWTDIDYFKTEQ